MNRWVLIGDAYIVSNRVVVGEERVDRVSGRLYYLLKGCKVLYLLPSAIQIYRSLIFCLLLSTLVAGITLMGAG